MYSVLLIYYPKWKETIEYIVIITKKLYLSLLTEKNWDLKYTKIGFDSCYLNPAVISKKVWLYLFIIIKV